MASNDYYHGNRPPSPGGASQSPYYGHAHAQGTYTPSIASTPAPPYSSASTYAAPSSNSQPHRADTVSPFDTVFDDPAYPTDSTQNGFRHNAYNNNNMPRQQAGPYGNLDTAYYGQQQQQQQPQPYNSSPSPASAVPAQAHFADDIPLQNQGQNPNLPHDQPPAKDVEMNDHVYEAPGSSGRKKSRRVGFGQLGMLGADKKRIAWVVYILTIAQVGVFIGQIVRNGMLGENNQCLCS